jgi:WXG100 family type VII secretion target
VGYRINYSKVIRQANSIGDNADDLSAQIKQIDTIESDLRSSWKGQAADAFLAKLTSLRSDMNRTKQNIDSLSETIKYCANRIQREDEEQNRQAATLK